MLKRQKLAFALGVAGGLLAVFAAAGARAGEVALNAEGIAINGGSLGEFVIPYPVITVEGVKDELKPSEVRPADAAATLKYPGEIALNVKLEAEGKVALTFSGNTEKLRKFRCQQMLIPFNFRDGGSWRVGSGEFTLFPAQQPPKPFLFQGNQSSLELCGVDDKKLKLEIPPFSFQQLQDNREWNWQTFAWMFLTSFEPGQQPYVIKVSFDASSAKSVKLVDRFGQSTRKEFPGKIQNEEELKADVAADQAYYAGLTPPATDAWGGLPESGKKLGLKATGFFHVEPKGEKWLLVDPAGNACFHLGVCSFNANEDYTYVQGRENLYEWLPPREGEYAACWHPQKYWSARAASFFIANQIRKFGAYDAEPCLERMVDRVRRFGFNAIGAFSSSPVFKRKKIPYVAHLPLDQWTLGGGLPGVRGVFDPFDEATLKKLDELFKQRVATEADEPLLVGYFLENEQAFEDLPRVVPGLPAKHACKRQLVKLLKAKYGEIAAFNAAWNAHAESFLALEEPGLPLTTPAAFEDMQAYVETFLDAYYRSIAETFHKYDRHHLLLGNRWQPGTANNEILCRVAGKYVDVVSINYYTAGIDPVFMRRLYEWTGRRPQLWSEFYYTAEKESNVAGRGQDLDTQAQRGEAYRQYVEGAAALGFVVGIEWFTLIDQSVSGRFFEQYNGERCNTGLFNVADRPYKDLIAQMLKTHQAVYPVWLDGQAPFVFDHPNYSTKGGGRKTVEAGHATAAIQIDGRLEGWPGRPPERIGGDRLVVGRESGGLEASFKACWDEQYLYLLVEVTDSTPLKNTQTGGKLWMADGIEVFFGSEKPDKGGTLLFTDRQVLIGAGQSGQFHVMKAIGKAELKTAVVPAVDGKGYVVEAAIPWDVLAVKKPEADREFLFDLAVDDSSDGQERRCQLMWNGIDRNSSDRGAWGRLRLRR